MKDLTRNYWSGEMNWYKISQEWYTAELAANTKNPNILRNVWDY